LQKNIRNNENEFYELLIKLEKYRERHNDCNNKVNELKISSESLQEKVWQLNNKSIVKTNRCSDGRLVEAKHKYNEAIISEDYVKQLEKSLLWLRETVANDNCVNSYFSQLVRLEIENFMTEIINESDHKLKTNKLRNAISALFAYQRRCLMHDNDNDLIQITLKWLLNIVCLVICFVFI
jgi:DNA repair exonuclease SbcCD ATPase subunit